MTARLEAMSRRLTDDDDDGSRTTGASALITTNNEVSSSAATVLQSRLESDKCFSPLFRSSSASAENAGNNSAPQPANFTGVLNNVTLICRVMILATAIASVHQSVGWRQD